MEVPPMSKTNAQSKSQSQSQSELEPEFDEFIEDDEAGPVIHQKPGTLRIWRSQGKGPRYFKIGRKALYRRRDLLEFIESRVVEPKNGKADA